MRIVATLLMVFAFIAGSIPVQAANHRSTSQLTEGEVRKIDKDAKKLTIRHGPIANLEMPAMTMVFQVKDSAMLEKVKVGDRIGFVAEKAGGVLTITHIEAMK